MVDDSTQREVSHIHSAVENMRADLSNAKIGIVELRAHIESINKDLMDVNNRFSEMGDKLKIIERRLNNIVVLAAKAMGMLMGAAAIIGVAWTLFGDAAKGVIGQ